MNTNETTQKATDLILLEQLNDKINELKTKLSELLDEYFYSGERLAKYQEQIKEIIIQVDIILAKYNKLPDAYENDINTTIQVNNYLANALEFKIKLIHKKYCNENHNLFDKDELIQKINSKLNACYKKIGDSHVQLGKIYIDLCNLPKDSLPELIGANIHNYIEEQCQLGLNEDYSNVVRYKDNYFDYYTELEAIEEKIYRYLSLYDELDYDMDSCLDLQNELVTLENNAMLAIEKERANKLSYPYFRNIINIIVKKMHKINHAIKHQIPDLFFKKYGADLVANQNIKNCESYGTLGRCIYYLNNDRRYLIEKYIEQEINFDTYKIEQENNIKKINDVLNGITKYDECGCILVKSEK